ncbi:hypothetical protein KC906_01685 [Candidatus Kaiserbacteria bacterium]|nr:hypothetical protein [Candidatus Kaiserbacteria bacterium]MCB9812295.1 hypothetical protein [Candidatus Nomurabacteria bacterium]
MEEAFKNPVESDPTIGTYDKEAVEKEAYKTLDQMLVDITVPESVPEQFHEVAKLEILRYRLDNEETGNEFRHVARVLETEIQEVLGNMPHRDFTIYQYTYRSSILAAEQLLQAA